MTDQSLITLQSLTAKVLTAMAVEDWSLAASLQQQREQLVKVCVPQFQRSLSSDALRECLMEMQAFDRQIDAALKVHQAQLDQATKNKIKAEKAIEHYRHQNRQK
jgi:hypothetical protein